VPSTGVPAFCMLCRHDSGLTRIKKRQAGEHGRLLLSHTD
jgi:hypothetical protein